MRFFIDTITTTVIKHDNLDFYEKTNYPNDRNFLILCDYRNLTRLVKNLSDRYTNLYHNERFESKISAYYNGELIDIINQYKIELRKSKLNKI